LAPLRRGFFLISRRDYKDTMTTIRKKAGMPNPTDKHVGSRVRLRRRSSTGNG